MNQTPTKSQTRHSVLPPVVLPKHCAPPKGLVICTVITGILLVLSLMTLSVALLVGVPEAPAPVQDGSGGGAKLSSAASPNSETLDTRPKIAITFDDGPHNVRTKAIVDELEKYGYHATFFVIGNRVDGTEYNGAEALRYAAEHGNEIGIHGYTHWTTRYYDSCSDEIYDFELSSTYQAITKVLPDAEVKLMRPVGGRITANRVASCPYSVIMWDIDSEDWKYKSTENAEENINTIVENVMSQVHEGGIILMHDIYGNTFEATKIILQRLNEEGYNVVSVSELLGSSMKSGAMYSSKVN